MCARTPPTARRPAGSGRRSSLPRPARTGARRSVLGSGTMRTSPTGPMPSTGWRVSSMDIAIIATVCPIPVCSRSASIGRDAALPRMIPPWSAYRNRTSDEPVGLGLREHAAGILAVARRAGHGSGVTQPPRSVQRGGENHDPERLSRGAPGGCGVPGPAPGLPGPDGCRVARRARGLPPTGRSD